MNCISNRRIVVCVVGMLFTLLMLSMSPKRAYSESTEYARAGSDLSIYQAMPDMQSGRSAADHVPMNIDFYNRMISSIDPDRYVVDSGDVFSVLTWKPGLKSSEMLVTVDHGVIFLEMIGELTVGGLTLTDTIAKIKAAYFEKFKQFNVRVKLSRMRTYEVLVAGQVKSPGYYQLNPLTRLSTILDMAGGFNGVGSMRSITVYDDNGGSRVCDLTLFDEEGDAEQNPYILENSRIIVPVVYGRVMVKGGFIKPGNYEIVDGETLFSLIKYFKGLLPGADKSEIQLIRHVAQGTSGPRFATFVFSMEDIAGKIGKDFNVAPGDTLEAIDSSANYTVSIMGAVKNPGTHSYVDGMRLSDLIRAAGGLQLKAGRAGDSPGVEMSSIRNATLRRVSPETGESTETVIDLNALLIFHDGTQDIELKAGDYITVLVETQVVYVDGMVQHGGFFPYDPDKSVKDYIYMAGGPKQESDIGRSKLTRNGVTTYISLSENVLPGDSINVPPDKSYNLSRYLGFLSNLYIVFQIIGKTN